MYSSKYCLLDHTCLVTMVSNKEKTENLSQNFETVFLSPFVYLKKISCSLYKIQLKLE